MKKTAVLSNVIISVILNLLFGAVLIGAGIWVLLDPRVFGTLLNAAFALIGLMLILTSIPNLISGIATFKEKKGKFDLIFSIVTMVVGVCLAFFGVVSVMYVIGLGRLINALPAELMQTMNVVRTVLYWGLCLLIALYLLVLPIIRIIKADKKFMQFKAELVKIILGVLILALLLCGVLMSVMNNLVGIVLIVLGALTVLLAILHLILGLIGLGKKDPKVEVVAAVDVDGDGVADGVVVDTDGDGKADAILLDADGDGKTDTVLADTDGDGQVDAVAMDVDGDGQADVVAAEIPDKE